MHLLLREHSEFFFSFFRQTKKVLNEAGITQNKDRYTGCETKRKRTKGHARSIDGTYVRPRKERSDVKRGTHKGNLSA